MRVITSARLDSRAPAGFGAALNAVNQRLMSSTSLPTAATHPDEGRSEPLAAT